MHVSFPLSYFFPLICLSCCFLQDQYDIIEKHTQSGLELVEKYVKFVKERTEIEQNYAKQLRQASIFSIVFFDIFPLLSALQNSCRVAACSCLRGCMWLFWKKKCLCGLVISAGQNLTCL